MDNLKLHLIKLHISDNVEKNLNKKTHLIQINPLQWDSISVRGWILSFSLYQITAYILKCTWASFLNEFF